MLRSSNIWNSCHRTHKAFCRRNITKNRSVLSSFLLFWNSSVGPPGVRVPLQQLWWLQKCQNYKRALRSFAWSKPLMLPVRRQEPRNVRTPAKSQNGSCHQFRPSVLTPAYIPGLWEQHSQGSVEVRTLGAHKVTSSVDREPSLSAVVNLKVLIHGEGKVATSNNYSSSLTQMLSKFSGRF